MTFDRDQRPKGSALEVGKHTSTAHHSPSASPGPGKISPAQHLVAAPRPERPAPERLNEAIEWARRQVAAVENDLAADWKFAVGHAKVLDSALAALRRVLDEVRSDDSTRQMQAEASELIARGEGLIEEVNRTNEQASAGEVAQRAFRGPMPAGGTSGGGFLGAVRSVASGAHTSKSSEKDAQPSPVTAGKLQAYLLHNQVDAWRTIGDHLNAVALPEPHERLHWARPAVFHQAVLDELAAQVGNFKQIQKLDEILFPTTSAAVIGPHLPSTTEWSIAVGMAIAHALHNSMVGSIKRVATRYLDVAGSRGAVGEDAVSFERLLLSMPIDRYVGKALCRRGVVSVEPLDAKASAAAKGKHVGLRPITKITLEGERDPKLWNWVRIEPADATAEDVAAELWKVTDGHGELNASFNAYLLAAAPPLFGIPKRMAIQMKRFSALAARSFRGNVATVIGDDTVDAQLLQIANSSAVGDVAHEAPTAVAQATIQHAPAKLGEVQEQLRDCDLQLAFIKQKLSPWGLAGNLAGASAFVKRQQTDVAHADAKKLDEMAGVVEGQKNRLARIGGAISALESAAQQLGARNPKGEEAAPILEILELLGVAAGTSHIAQASEPKLVQAMQLQATLGVRALQSSERNMIGAVTYVHQQVGDNRTTGNLSHEAGGLQEQSRQLQSKLLDGQSVDPEDLEDVLIRSEQVALNGRLYGTLDALKDMDEAVNTAGQGDAAIIASLFSGK